MGGFMRTALHLATVLSFLLFSNFASAFPGRPGPGPGPGRPGGPGGGRGEVINNPNVNGYLLMAGNFADLSAQRFCAERGGRGGRALSTQWITRAPAAQFNGRGWEFYPQADNYTAIASVECFDRGGGGGGGHFPDQTFNPPMINNYPLAANQETADAFCQQNRFRRGQIQQTQYVDTNPAYIFTNGAWLFSPRADHYYMIQTLACYRW